MRLLVGPNPRKFMPDTFQRSLAVVFHPPFTENSLQNSQQQTYQQAVGSSGVLVQPQSEAIIDKRPDDGLHNVVRHAHFTECAEYVEHAPGVFFVQEIETGNQHEHKCQI